MLVTDSNPAQLAVTDITKESMRTAFAAYARDHEAAPVRRCWSTWNVLCTFLYTSEQLTANPMQLVGRPKLAQPLPKALPRSAVEALLQTVAKDRNSKRQTELDPARSRAGAHGTAGRPASRRAPPMRHR